VSVTSLTTPVIDNGSVTAQRPDGLIPHWITEHPLEYQHFTAKQKRFLRAFAETCSIKQASRLAVIDKSTHFVWMSRDANYVAAFESCKVQAVQVLEDEAVRRASEGVDEPVFYKGEQCGTIRRYSDSLMMLLLKGHLPSRYREAAATNIAMSGGGALTVAMLDACLRLGGDAAPAGDPATDGNHGATDGQTVNVIAAGDDNRLTPSLATRKRKAAAPAKAVAKAHRKPVRIASKPTKRATVAAKRRR
jgi:hypothetical protein